MNLPDPGSTKRTKVKRVPRKTVHSREAAYAILDEGLIAHIAIIGKHGEPRCLPCTYVRDGDRLLLHGSRASQLFRGIAAGATVCVAVTLLDGIVYAPSFFDSSLNYRSVVIYGTGRAIPEDQLADMLLLFSERIMPGRGVDARGPNERELAQTMVVEIPLDECSVKISNKTGGEDLADPAVPCWTGVLPLKLTGGPPEAAPEVSVKHPVPDYLTARFGPG